MSSLEKLIIDLKLLIWEEFLELLICLLILLIGLKFFLLFLYISSLLFIFFKSGDKLKDLTKELFDESLSGNDIEVFKC